MTLLPYECPGLHDDERPPDWWLDENNPEWDDDFRSAQRSFHYRGHAVDFSGSAQGLAQHVTHIHMYNFNSGKLADITHNPQYLDWLYSYTGKVDLRRKHPKKSTRRKRFERALRQKQNRSYPGSQPRNKLKRTETN